MQRRRVRALVEGSNAAFGALICNCLCAARIGCAADSHRALVMVYFTPPMTACPRRRASSQLDGHILYFVTTPMRCDARTSARRIGYARPHGTSWSLRTRTRTSRAWLRELSFNLRALTASHTWKIRAARVGEAREASAMVCTARSRSALQYFPGLGKLIASTVHRKITQHPRATAKLPEQRCLHSGACTRHPGSPQPGSAQSAMGDQFPSIRIG